MKNDQQKKIIVFAGPSGVGKSTLSKVLLGEYDFFEFSISATTRDAREGEEDGTHYYFLSESEFKKRIQDNGFVEWEEVYEGRYYGTLASEIDRISEVGNVAIFDIDVLGAVNIKKQFGDQAVVVFVKPETTQALVDRLRSRGTETDDQIQMRADRFEKELSYQDSFDEVIVNKTGELEDSKKSLREIIKKHF